MAKLPACPVLIASLILSTCAVSSAAEVVTNEPTRMQVLRLIFPKATITATGIAAAEKPSAVKDPLGRVVAIVGNALEGETAYRVVGVPSKDEEGPSSIITSPTQAFADERRLRMKLYRWLASGRQPVLLAVVNYTFPKANPPHCCWAAGKLVLLTSTGDQILDSFDTMPNAFSKFTALRFIDIDASGAEKFVISADCGYAGVYGVKSAVFEVQNQKLNALSSVTTMIDGHSVYAVDLDELRTRQANGKRFFFTKKVFVDKGKILRTPVTRLESYPAARGAPIDWQ
jgi:hypothetical protein